MISLEQIQKLEARINEAVGLIRRLRGENESLRRSVDSAQEKVQKLEGLVGEFKTDQKEIEACIVRALQNLDRLEDEAAAPPAPRRERGGARKAAEAAAGAAAEPLEQGEADAETTPGGGGELDIF